ncbi:MAG: DUF4326 domain-containing protein [Planctomycetota bacterium]
MPKRIQRQRTKGWRMPEGAVYVGRPTAWGNPFTLNGDWIVWAAIALGFMGNIDGRRQAALKLYRAWMTGALLQPEKPRKDCGAITYDSGQTIETSEHVMGLAGWMASQLPMPELPPRPTLDELRGKDLACFCPPDQPCHADVLLELANR